MQNSIPSSLDKSKIEAEKLIDNSSSQNCSNTNVGCSFSLEELKPKEGHIFWDAEQLENFDKTFEDFKYLLQSQMREFSLKNNCRVIILDNELRAIINIRKSNKNQNTKS